MDFSKISLPCIFQSCMFQSNEITSRDSSIRHMTEFLELYLSIILTVSCSASNFLIFREIRNSVVDTVRSFSIRGPPCNPYRRRLAHVAHGYVYTTFNHASDICVR